MFQVALADYVFQWISENLLYLQCEGVEVNES